MEGFGIIIIDDKKPSLYAPLTGSEFKYEECFNNANNLRASIMSISAAIGVVFALY